MASSVTCCWTGTGKTPLSVDDLVLLCPFDDGIPSFFTCILHEINPLISRAVLRHFRKLWSKFAAVCLHKGMVIPPQQPEDICSNNFHTRSRSIFRLKTVEPWTTQCFPTKTLFQDLETHNKQAGLDIVRICTRTRYHIKPGTQGLDAAILTEFLGCHSPSESHCKLHIHKQQRVPSQNEWIIKWLSSSPHILFEWNDTSEVLKHGCKHMQYIINHSTCVHSLNCSIHLTNHSSYNFWLVIREWLWQGFRDPTVVPQSLRLKTEAPGSRLCCA